MSADAVILMLVLMTILWGGFAFALMVAVRRESRKSAGAGGDDE